MKLSENLALKITAVFVVFFASIGFLLGGAAAVYANEMGIYDGSSQYYGAENTYEESLRGFAENVIYDYFHDPKGFEAELEKGTGPYSAAYSNISLNIYGNTGELLISNQKALEGDGRITVSLYAALGDEGSVRMWESSEDQSSEWDITAEVTAPASFDEYDAGEYALFVKLHNGRYAFLYTASISALLLAIAFIYLCCGVGHIEGRPGITLNPQDKVPFDLYLAFMGGLMFTLAECFKELLISLYHYDRYEYILILCALMIGVFALLVLAVLLTSITRFKYGHWWENTIIWRGVKVFTFMVKSVIKGLFSIFTALRYEWRAAIIATVFSLCTVGGGIKALAALCAGIIIICLFANRLRRLFEGAQEIAGGNVDYKIDENGLYGRFRDHAVNLNSIAGGLGIAVEQRIKSERLKTELITNVSHDIKTPLTSIINYVDLLKKEPLSGRALEYANTLERHANRLKKLTEDLVEASKAATGNIKAELLPMNVCELINQAVGEYTERLEAGRIEPVVAIPPGARYILADGRLIWRVIENLLSNAAKYAQPGTRLYISLIERHGRLIIEMKNISRERLNIDAEELTERFVRGDSSRHTEGSGLGLNIARSLTELQHGKMSIEIDGDLFKVSLMFDMIEDQMDFLDELPIDM